MLIGVLGGGQLGMMMAQAGEPLGMKFRFLDPSPESPAASCGEHIIAPYEDKAALAAFARGLDFATWEFENVPCETVRRLADRVTVRPAAALLELAQDRLAEKRVFQEIGLQPARHLPVSSLADLEGAVRELGTPCILKTRRMGYDGKGQFFLREREDVAKAWAELGQGKPGIELILEGFVEYEREVSLIACRGVGAGTSPDRANTHGQTVFYPMSTNVHRGGILRVARVGDGFEVAPELEREARGAVARLLELFGYVGVLTVEFFVVNRFGGGQMLVANEMAPRVHNSGHWTIEGVGRGSGHKGGGASQFENHVRAIAGMPLGSGEMNAPGAAMVNIVGEAPDEEAARAIPGATLHMYGKSPRAGRKLGHLTIVGDRETVDRGVAAATKIAGMREGQSPAIE
ncbi:MAG: 5-(carboxyamino)imidazole ribonucleotide synthase [Phycisphaerales bacterium]